MLRVESNTDVRGFTEFEEDILFDEDDPDFDHKVPAIRVPFIFKEENNPNIYKWLAIITDAKCGLDGLDAKIKSFELMKFHLEKALELQPDDMATLYILGKWCYEMSRLTWFQRFIAEALYAKPPRSTYQEAYDYLVRAAELQNNDYYIPIFYVLGKTCLKMKQYFRARYYFHAATTLQPRSAYEALCVKKAKYLLLLLEKYDLDKDSILNNL